MLSCTAHYLMLSGRESQRLLMLNGDQQLICFVVALITRQPMNMKHKDND